MPLVTRTSAQSFVFKQAAAPTSGMVVGDVWIDTDNGVLSTYSGSAWVQQTPGALGAASTAIMVNSGGTALEYGSPGTIKHVGISTLSGAADTLEVTGISPTYDCYIVEAQLLSSGAIQCNMRFNNDSGNNYGQGGTDSGTGAFSSSAQAQINGQGSSSASTFNVNAIIINKAAAQIKTAYITATYGTASGITNGGVWNNATDLINRIAFWNGAAGDYAIGSTMTVKGFNFAS